MGSDARLATPPAESAGKHDMLVEVVQASFIYWTVPPHQSDPVAILVGHHQDFPSQSSHLILGVVGVSMIGGPGRKLASMNGCPGTATGLPGLMYPLVPQSLTPLWAEQQSNRLTASAALGARTTSIVSSASDS